MIAPTRPDQFPAPPTEPEARERVLYSTLRRLPTSLFQFDPRMASGWLSDRYFVRTARTVEQAGLDPVVTMQVFTRVQGVVAGVYECLRMLQTQLASRPRNFTVHDLEISTLLDGDSVEPWEPVMHITGPYLAFAHLETTYLGVLADRTLIASNVRRAITAANGKDVIFMAARHADWRRQVADGYAAIVGGAAAVSSDANGAWWGERGVGTMPHAMISAFGGDTVAATVAFARYLREQEPEVTSVSAVVDYDNDVIGTSLDVARAMRDEFGHGSLHSVRVDTSSQLVDVSLQGRESEYPGVKISGVSLPLVRLLRKALDDAGFREVGIVASGGFTPSRIREFEAVHAPVVSYGIGSSLLGHNRGPEIDDLLTSADYTADIVLLNGKPEAKVGREYRANPRHVKVDTHRLVETDEQDVRR
jgi:nicotinate phosphoribosyltransferase